MPQPGRRPAIDPDDVLELLEETDVLFHSTGEIADKMDASKPTVLDRLRTLKEEGRIRSRKVAGNTPIWYLPAVENRRLDEYNDEGDEGDGDAPDVSEPEDPDVVADGRGWGRYIEYRAAVWGEQAAGGGVVLTLAGALAWILTKLPMPELLPTLAAGVAIVGGFVFVLAAIVLLGISMGLAWIQGRGHGEVIEYIFTRTLPRADGQPGR